MGMYSTAVASQVASIGTSFDKTKYHLHKLNSVHPGRVADTPFTGRVSALYVKVSTISGATQLTARLVADADGDEIFLPDTPASLSTGITTTTEGWIVIRIEVVYKDQLNSDNLYLMLKTDAGTVTLEESRISWED